MPRRSRSRSMYRNPPRHGIDIMERAARGLAAAYAIGRGRSRTRATSRVRSASVSARTTRRGGVTPPSTPNVRRRSLRPRSRNRSLSSVSMRSVSSSRRSSGDGSFANAGSISKFAKPTAAGLSIGNAYIDKGFSYINEQYGTVTDGDCVYVMHTPLTVLELIDVAFASILRKLFEKGLNWSAKSVDDIIPSFVSGSGGGSASAFPLKVRITGGNPAIAGGDNVYSSIASFTLLTGSTIATIVAALNSTFRTYSTLSGLASDSNTVEPMALILQRTATVTAVSGGGPGDQDTTLAIMYFEEMVVNFGGYSKLSIQNSTVANAGSVDAFAVDSNPINGMVYNFSGLPKIRLNNMYLFQTMTANIPIKTFAAASLPVDFKMPPPARVFSNTTAAAAVILNPGEIKTSVIRFSKKMKFLKMLKVIRAGFSATGSVTTYTMFPCQLISLKECINTGGVSSVTIRFETTYQYGCYCTTKKAHVSSMPKYSSANVVTST